MKAGDQLDQVARIFVLTFATAFFALAAVACGVALYMLIEGASRCLAGC